MRKIAKIALVSMTIATVAYLAMVFHTYALGDSTDDAAVVGPVYAAFEYKEGAPPSTVFTPEELGIVKIIEHENEDGSYWLHAVVSMDRPAGFQYSQPVFIYKEKLYKISQLWATPGSEGVPLEPILLGATLVPAGWMIPGILYLKDRKQ